MRSLRSVPPRKLLDELRRDGLTPIRIRKPLTIEEVAAWARELPPMRTEGVIDPSGWAIMPPFNQGPLLKLKREVRDLAGAVTLAGQIGLVGAVWASKLRPSSAVFRLWMRGDGKGRDVPMVPLDVYEDDIGAEVVIKGLVRYRSGYWIVHTDDQHDNDPGSLSG